MSLDPFATTLFAYKGDYRAEAKRWLLSQFRDKPRIVALVQAFGQGSQVLEDICIGYLLGMLMGYAIGDQLDHLGSIVGERRAGLLDAEYIRFIQARILVNRCSGTPTDMVQLLELVTAPSTVHYHDMFPGGFTLYAHRSSAMPDAIKNKVRRLMRDAKPAGVAMVLIETIPGYFGYDGDPDARGFDVGRLSRLI